MAVLNHLQEETFSIVFITSLHCSMSHLTLNKQRKQVDYIRLYFFIIHKVHSLIHLEVIKYTSGLIQDGTDPP